MTLTSITSLESATRKFFMNSTDMMPTKNRREENFSERRKFFMNSTYMMSRS